MPTIIVPALSGIQNEQNRNEFLSITPEQASWIGKTFIRKHDDIPHHIEMFLTISNAGSIGFVAQTFSGLVSGLVTGNNNNQNQFKEKLLICVRF